MSGGSTTPDRIFVGGTGRSGTHVMGSLLGQHSHYRRIHTELRFHADPPGLPGLLDGTVQLPDFLENLRGRWWKRTASNGNDTGLCKRISEETFNEAIAKFERTFPEDPWDSSSKLVHDLLDPIAAQAKKPGWAEMTKRTIESSPVLLKLVPDARFINMIRDGRDVASSVTVQKWGSDDFGEALAWWEERVAGAERGSSQIPADHLLVMGMEDLVSDDREGSYTRLLDFIGVKPRFRGLRERKMRRYFDEEVGRRDANLERWREGLSTTEQDDVTERYAKALERLIAGDTPARPLLERWLASVAGTVPVAA